MPAEPRAIELADIVAIGGRSDPPILTLPGLDIPAGRRYGIAGPSGAGKTTLLHVIGALLRPTRGKVRWGESELGGLDAAARDAWRRETVGFVFQDFQLIPELSALDNVLLPVWFARVSAAGHAAAAHALLDRIGIRRPAQRAATLSRGEQQRVALARALLHRPPLILADEPTASLDASAGAEVVRLLLDAASETGATLLVVSHDRALLDRMDAVISLDRGVLV